MAAFRSDKPLSLLASDWLLLDLTSTPNLARSSKWGFGLCRQSPNTLTLHSARLAIFWVRHVRRATKGACRRCQQLLLLLLRWWRLSRLALKQVSSTSSAASQLDASPHSRPRRPTILPFPITNYTSHSPSNNFNRLLEFLVGHESHLKVNCSMKERESRHIRCFFPLLPSLALTRSVSTPRCGKWGRPHSRHTGPLPSDRPRGFLRHWRDRKCRRWWCDGRCVTILVFL